MVCQVFVIKSLDFHKNPDCLVYAIWPEYEGDESRMPRFWLIGGGRRIVRHHDLGLGCHLFCIR